MELLELEPEAQNFVVKRHVIYVLLYILTMRKTNLMLKFSLDPLKFRNYEFHGIARI